MRWILMAIAVVLKTQQKHLKRISLQFDQFHLCQVHFRRKKNPNRFYEQQGDGGCGGGCE